MAAVRCELIHGDDPDYVTQNPHLRSGLTLSSARWAFTAPLCFRLGNALTAYVQSMDKMVWPSGLALLYPYPHAMVIWKLVIAVILLGCASFFAIRHAVKRPYFFTGWFWSVGTLMPVIGLVQVGVHSMADR